MSFKIKEQIGNFYGFEYCSDHLNLLTDMAFGYTPKSFYANSSNACVVVQRTRAIPSQTY